MVIRCSSVSTLTRIDWLAILSASWTSVVDGRGLLGRLCLGFLCGRLGAGAASGAGAALATGRRRGRGFGLGLAEGALEVVERDFAGTQAGAPAPASTSVPCVIAGCTGGCGDDGDRRGRGLSRGFRRMVAAFGHRMQLLDQIFVGALGLGLGGLEAGEDFLDAVDARTGSASRLRP